MLSLKYKAILFDFDGTMFDTWPGLKLALENTYKKFINSNINSNYFDTLRPYMNLKRSDLLTQLLGRAPTSHEEEYFIFNYKSILTSSLLPYDGLLPLIEFFNENEIIWGIVTNKPKIYFEGLFKNFPLLNTYSCLVCADDVENKKPHPEPIIKACSILKINPNEGVYIGDSITDLIAAKSCGMDFILASYGYNELESFKDNQNQIKFSIQNLLEIKEIVFQETRNVNTI